jgi:hypothetical protein
LIAPNPIPNGNNAPSTSSTARGASAVTTHTLAMYNSTGDRTFRRVAALDHFT